MKTRLALLLAVVVLGSACAAPSPSPSAGSPSPSGSSSSDISLAIANVPRASADPALATDAGRAINAFALDLYRQLAIEDRNVVVSPASIALALGMARAGARGQTATEMDAVLHDLATDDHAGWLNALDAALAARSGAFQDRNGKDSPVTLRIANASFAQRDMPIEPAYLDALASRYGAGLQLVDYRTQAEAARKAINDWVAAQTEDRIPEILAPGSIDDATRLALVNAIYLKAGWLTPFAKEATADGPFDRPDGTRVTVPMMNTGETFHYAAGDGWQAVELPYVGEQLGMTVIVPDDLTAFENGLTPVVFDEITGALEPRTVILTLPRFAIESKVELADVLTAMGMPTAFVDGSADFSGITTAEQLFISAVIHQANIDVDEDGTTAAAATVVAMAGSAAPTDTVTLRVDRPFLFALRDLQTGTVLFLGRVTDPSTRD